MSGEAVAGHRAEIHHQHRDVTGGWLRPAVFGVMDGLVSNFALIAGVAGGGAEPGTVALAGLAGLVAGAFSMATGEYTSVASQTELTRAEIAVEQAEIRRRPEAELAELAGLYEARGVEPALARRVAEQLSRDPEQAWRVHAREELGVDPDDLPSPWTAAGRLVRRLHRRRAAAAAAVPARRELAARGGRPGRRRPVRRRCRDLPLHQPRLALRGSAAVAARCRRSRGDLRRRIRRRRRAVLTPPAGLPAGTRFR